MLLCLNKRLSLLSLETQGVMGMGGGLAPAMALNAIQSD
jgi:hypothetical protein